MTFTIGFELEAVADNLAADFEGLPQTVNNIHPALAQRLATDSQERVTAHDQFKFIPIDYNTLNITLDTSVDLATESSESYVAPDENGDQPIVQDRCSFELISPVLALSTANNVSAALAHRLKTFFVVLDEAISWKVNTTAGLHVHIGREPPFSLEEVKKISKVSLKFEEVIDQIHAPHRGQQPNVHLSSTRNNEIFTSMSIEEALNYIDSRASMFDLLACLNHDIAYSPDGGAKRKSYRVNFTNMQK